MTYVNYRGEEIGLIDHGRAPKPKKDEQPYHNGWRVQGIPPGALEEAKEKHQREARLMRDGGKEVKDFDQELWLMNAKRKPLRKPYELEAAARECKALAEKAGWLRVEIVELKREKSAA